MKNLAIICLLSAIISSNVALGSQDSTLMSHDNKSSKDASSSSSSSSPKLSDLAQMFHQIKEAAAEVTTCQKYQEYRDLDNQGLGYPSSFFEWFRGHLNGKTKPGDLVTALKALKGLQELLNPIFSNSDEVFKILSFPPEIIEIVNHYAIPHISRYERLKSLKRIDVYEITRGVARIDPPLLQEAQDCSESKKVETHKQILQLNEEDIKLEYGSVLNLLNQIFNLEKIEELKIGITHFDPKKNNLDWHVKAICVPKLFPSVRKIIFTLVYHREQFWGPYEDVSKVKKNILDRFTFLKETMPAVKDICFEDYLDIDD